jgi:hypothetical protein
VRGVVVSLAILLQRPHRYSSGSAPKAIAKENKEISF